MPSKSNRKRQSRLAFTPLPSSSPAAKSYHKQIRDRAAAVVLEGSPSPVKRRKTQNIIEDEQNTSAIPTPPDEDDNVDDSDDEPLRPTQSRSAKQSRARQQRLDFSSAREPSSFDSPVTLTSSARRSRKAKSGIFSSQARGQIADVTSDESEGSDVVLSQRKSKSRSKGKSAEGTTRARAMRSSNMPVVEEDEESDEIVVGAARAVPRAEEASEDDDEDMPTTLGKQKRQRKRRSSRGSFIDDSSPQVISDNDEEDEVPMRRGRKRKVPSSPPDSPPAADESDDDVEIIERPSKRRRRAESDEDEGEDMTPKTPKRTLKKRRHMSEQEEEELAEDLEFLKPSSDEEESGHAPRSTQSAKKSAQQRALEMLKQKRGGHSSQPIPIEEDEEEDRSAQEDDDDDLEMVDDEDDVDDDPEILSHNTTQSMFRENDEDADFLVDEEDDDAVLGIPEDMPIEYTRYASMKSKELFKWAVEWFVQRKINPAFNRNDQIYKLTFRKLDDEVQGLSNSKFTSSAWVPRFVIALQARPAITWDRLDRDADGNWLRDKCDACNRSGHPATFAMQFQLPTYNRETLDEIANEEDEDEDEESDSGSSDDRDKTEYDVQGREVVPASTTFYVGKFCKRNAQSAHSLYHWRWHLAEYIEGWLEGKGYLTPAQLAKRDKWDTSKRRRKANQMVDEMNREGEVQKLWKMFRDNIDDARKAKQGGRYAADSP